MREVEAEVKAGGERNEVEPRRSLIVGYDVNAAACEADGRCRNAVGSADVVILEGRVEAVEESEYPDAVEEEAVVVVGE